MTPQLKDILKTLDVIAPFSMAEEWDNSGFQVGFLSDKIKKAFISLDPTIEALRSARAANAQLLITHHPLIFNPLARIDSNAYPGDVITEALTSRISIVAMHTNFDMAKGGINDILARMIGLQKCEALCKNNEAGDPLEGLGRIGYLPEILPLKTIARIIMDSIGAMGSMIIGAPDKKIKKVAILGGAGGSELSRAAEKGADLYVTGDIRHHDALMAQTLDLALMDVGHFNMERAAMHVFAGDLRDKFKEQGWNLDIEIFEDEKAPMWYLCREDAD